MKWRFQSLLKKDKDGHITGPMSPVLFTNAMAKADGFPVHGLVRVNNPQSESTYDHLIIKSVHKNVSVYRMYCDMGIAGCPMGMLLSDENKAVMTPIYAEQVKKMETHRWNVELPKRDKKSNPIMVITGEDLVELIKQAEETDAFKIE